MENKMPELNDACIKCYNEARRRRRWSTCEPPSIKCHFDCGDNIIDITMCCIKCSSKYNACPWCLTSPYIKNVKVDDKKNVNK